LPPEATTFPSPDLPDISEPAVSDAMADRMRELEVTSLFASNIALTYREDSNYGDLLRSTPPLARTSGSVSDDVPYPAYAFPPPPSFTIPTSPNPQPGAVAPGVVPETPAPPTGEGPAADFEAAGPRLPLTRSALSAPESRLFTMFEGTVLETALVNRLDSSFAGPIITMVTNDAYSHDRQHVLIPAGTKCIGRTAPVESLGQTRMAVSFHRLIMPDGYSVDLDQFEGLNQLGDTGLKDKVNHHYFQIFGVSIALGFLGAISQNELEYPFDSAGPQFARSAAQVLDRFLNILPTVTIREGHRVKVYLTQDLKLPAYDAHGGI
jgi:type IV secretion system protein VirB10